MKLPKCKKTKKSIEKYDMIMIVGEIMKRIVRTIWNLLYDMDKPLLVVTLVLFLFGTINIVTASSSEAVSYNVSLYYYFYKQMRILLAGIFVSIFIISIPSKKWEFPAILSFIGVTILLFLTLKTEANRGAQNWVFGIQPSEFAKPILIFYKNGFK